MDKESLKSAIEALLFAYGEPVSAKKLAELTDTKIEQVFEVLGELDTELRQTSNRGLMLLNNNESYQLATKPENSIFVEKLVKQDFQEELSPASLEVLTIVLYRGSLSRSEIDYIRGVNSSFTVRSLMLRGLIERLPDTVGHHLFLYSPSFALLQFLGVAAVKDLPDYAVLNKKYEEILAASGQTAGSEQADLQPVAEAVNSVQEHG